MEKILIIEDDVGISNSLKLYLENSGFVVELLHSGEFGVENILSKNYDIVILDVNLPVKDGFSICKEVRTHENNTPIIMLTARSNDKIEGLELGADDYISKPFSPRELIARIKSLLRRSFVSKPKSLIAYKNIEINLDKQIVLKNNKEVSFTKNEFDILQKIFLEDGKLVARETLMKDIIGYDNYAFDRTIDTHIKNIRKKLDDKDIILTIRGKGYRINK